MKYHRIPAAYGYPPIEVNAFNDGDVVLLQEPRIDDAESDAYGLVMLSRDQAEKLLCMLDLLLSGNDENDE